MQSFEVQESISYGQFYLFSDGHTDPDALDTSELVEIALTTGNGFASGLGSLVVLVPDLVNGCGQLTLRVERWPGPAPKTAERGFAGRFDVGPGGLLLGTVDAASYQQVPVTPGRYDIRVTQESSPTPEETTFWSVRLYDAVGPRPRPATRRRSGLSTEKKVARVMDSLPRTDAWWGLTQLRLDEEYNQILWDVAPTITKPTIVNLYRTGITELPVWLTRVPYLVGLLAHDNDLDALPDWLPELRRLQRLAVSGNRRLTDLPDTVARLPLTRLEIDQTGIAHLPDVVRRLHRLELIDLSDTAITELPDWLADLPALKVIHFRNSRLSEFPDWIRQRIADHSLALHR